MSGAAPFDSSGREDWLQWEEDYRRFVLHYARLAAETDMEMFCIGIELHLSIRHRPLFWRRLIDEVREVYPGAMTYGANWFQEYQEVDFWDQLDYIGIHAYFPVDAAAECQHCGS